MLYKCQIIIIYFLSKIIQDRKQLASILKLLKKKNLPKFVFSQKQRIFLVTRFSTHPGSSASLGRHILSLPSLGTTILRVLQRIGELYSSSRPRNFLPLKILSLLCSSYLNRPPYMSTGGFGKVGTAALGGCVSVGGKQMMVIME